MKFLTITLTSVLVLAATTLRAGDWGAPSKDVIVSENCKDVPYDTHRVDAHAPIGVMGDHLHAAGETMLSYRFNFMNMRPNFVGSDEVTPRSQLSAPGTGPFQIMPTDMQMQMHMVGVMHAPTDNVTLALMLPYMEKKMEHLVANGTTFNTGTSGVGDFKFGGLVKLFDKGNTRSHLNLMMSAPTGSITETGFVPPAGRTVRLPYAMQLGSGTWDFMPGITYLGQCNDLSWGAQVIGTLRLGENPEDYSLGNAITGTAWSAYKITGSISTSFRVAASSRGDIDGRDALIGGPVPTTRPDLRGGESVDLYGGFNYLFQGGPLAGNRLAIEAGAPVYQDLDGPQLGTDWTITVGWQKAW